MKKLITWVEIPATDMERAVAFYNSVFNLNLSIQDFDEEKMACFPNDEGAISLSPGFTPSKEGTLVSFIAEDGIELSLQRVTETGGTIITPKTKIEAEGRGYFATVLDSEGNQIGLYADK